MKIKYVKNLGIPEIKVIGYERFHDERGYFTETFRGKNTIVQCNQSYSKTDTLRGLHFQFDPYIGKFVRVIKGEMLDLVLDIRKKSRTFGKLLMYHMSEWNEKSKYDEWIWIPKGFAHGCYFMENSIMEYLYTGMYNPRGEICVSPLAKDIDLSLLNDSQKAVFKTRVVGAKYISDKDRKGLTIEEWKKDKRLKKFKWKC